MIAVVRDLIPGDKVYLGERWGTFIARSPHPKYPTLVLVIWKLDDGTWSLDALSPNQEVGELSFETGRWERVKEAFGV